MKMYRMFLNVKFGCKITKNPFDNKILTKKVLIGLIESTWKDAKNSGFILTNNNFFLSLHRNNRKKVSKSDLWQ